MNILRYEFVSLILLVPIFVQTMEESPSSPSEKNKSVIARIQKEEKAEEESVPKGIDPFKKIKSIRRKVHRLSADVETLKKSGEHISPSELDKRLTVIESNMEENRKKIERVHTEMMQHFTTMRDHMKGVQMAAVLNTQTAIEKTQKVLGHIPELESRLEKVEKSLAALVAYTGLNRDKQMEFNGYIIQLLPMLKVKKGKNGEAEEFLRTISRELVRLNQSMLAEGVIFQDIKKTGSRITTRNCS